MSEIAAQAIGLSVRLGERSILQNISFDLPAGSFLAVVGPNGAGKSTLVKTMLGLVESYRGSLKLFDREVRETARTGVNLGYVPQLKTMNRNFPGTGIELVVSGTRGAWPARISKPERAQAIDALRQVNAEHLADRRISHLSGGELQRVYLARAVIRHPRIILLDEPFTGVDLVAEAVIYQILDDLHKTGSMTIVLVTHDLGVVYHHASHVLLVNHQLIAFGKPLEVLTESCLAKAYGHTGHTFAVHPDHEHGHDHGHSGHAHPPTKPRNDA